MLGVAVVLDRHVTGAAVQGEADAVGVDVVHGDAVVIRGCREFYVYFVVYRVMLRSVDAWGLNHLDRSTDA